MLLGKLNKWPENMRTQSEIVKQLCQVYKNYHRDKLDMYRIYNNFRYGGYIECLLYTLGILNLNQKLDYKTIETPKSFLGFKYISKRKETYIELMLRMTEEYLEKENEHSI